MVRHSPHTASLFSVLMAALMVSLFLAGGAAAQAQPRSPAPGRGLLPKPAEMPTVLEGTPPAHPFKPDPSGGFSRTLFETDEDPNVKIIIRDFSFPPNRQPQTLIAPSALMLHVLSGPGNIRVAGQPITLQAGERVTVTANAPIEVTNNGDRPIVLRAVIVEAK